jgi:hypothetical protein
MLPVPPRVTQLILDSSLLLILAVGKLEPHRLGRDARLKAYTPADYELLRAYSAMFPTRVTTPHVLAEVSNHLDLINPSLLPALGAALIDWNPLRESWIPARTLAARDEYPVVGLTDTAILHAARPKTVVMTSDRHLWAELIKQRRNALHYADVMPR